MKTLVICSGGLDSVTLAYKVAAQQQLCALLSFDYGQRHQREIAYAKKCALALDVEHHVVDIRHVGAQLSGSALTDDIAVPHGHYAQSNMAQTIVPNRNAIMLTIAFGMAVSRQLEQVAIAVHGGDHFIYPDCRPDFIEAFAKMQNQALSGVADIALYAPFLQMDKSDIVRQGQSYHVPFEDTWSCYEGEGRHCGRCGTCVERQEAFSLAAVHDPTDYVDATYWHQAVAQYQQSKG